MELRPKLHAMKSAQKISRRTVAMPPRPHDLPFLKRHSRSKILNPSLPDRAILTGTRAETGIAVTHCKQTPDEILTGTDSPFFTALSGTDFPAHRGHAKTIESRGVCDPPTAFVSPSPSFSGPAAAEQSTAMARATSATNGGVNGRS
jgi:hypothetical protein